MVLFVLYIKAELENVGSISLPEGYQYCISVKDSASDEAREGVYVSAAEEHELSGSRGTANFTIKFAKDAKKEASLNVVEVKGVTREYTADDDRQFVPIIGFECRGIEPTAFHPENGWLVKSTGGKSFEPEDVDLREKEWADFDENANESVGIYAFESKFEVVRQK